MTNNMRRGFTMIELVFVIVIIGILAAVALPRFTGIADDARTSKLEAFTGTMNKTVGPTMWSTVLRKFKDANGNLADTTHITDAKYHTVFVPDAATLPGTASAADAQVQSIPSEFTDTGTASGTPIDNIDLSACDVPNNPTNDAAITGATAVATAEIGTSTYELVCSPGSLATSPHFYLLDATDSANKKIIVR